MEEMNLFDCWGSKTCFDFSFRRFSPFGMEGFSPISIEPLRTTNKTNAVLPRGCLGPRWPYSWSSLHRAEQGVSMVGRTGHDQT